MLHERHQSVIDSACLCARNKDYTGFPRKRIIVIWAARQTFTSSSKVGLSRLWLYDIRLTSIVTDASVLSATNESCAHPLGIYTVLGFTPFFRVVQRKTPSRSFPLASKSMSFCWSPADSQKAVLDACRSAPVFVIFCAHLRQTILTCHFSCVHTTTPFQVEFVYYFFNL
jgi:hypothetical protein